MNEFLKILLPILLTGLGAYLMFRLHRTKERRAETRSDLKELHLGCLQAFNAFTKMATDTNEFLHGEKGDLKALSAVAAFTQPCNAIMMRVESLQRQCAREYQDEWDEVVEEAKRICLLEGEVLIGRRSISDIESSLISIKVKIGQFALRVEEKLESI